MGLGQTFVGIAGSLLSTFGTDITVIRESQGAMSADGTSAPLSATTVTVKGIIEKVVMNSRPGELIQSGDHIVLIQASALTFVPKPGTDRLKVDGKLFQIVTVAPIKPTGVAVVHRILARP